MTTTMLTELLMPPTHSRLGRSETIDTDEMGGVENNADDDDDADGYADASDAFLLDDSEW